MHRNTHTVACCIFLSIHLDLQGLETSSRRGALWYHGQPGPRLRNWNVTISVSKRGSERGTCVAWHQEVPL